MSKPLSRSAQKVQDALSSLGYSLQVKELTHSTRSAAEAADAIGCRVEQIAKSLVFKGKRSGEPFLVIASGANRVNAKKLKEVVSEPVTLPDAQYVREHTGYVIGGVPPMGHTRQILTFIDEDLLKSGEIWAAAGTPNAMFRLTPDELVEITGGRVICIT